MTELLQLDQTLFFLINGKWNNTFFDAIMPYWREKMFWAPVYIFLVFFILLNFRLKGFYYILAVVAVIAVSDTTSSKIIKQTVERLRPCNDESIRQEVNLLVPCGSGYSFTSSHATNHFALATFFIFTLCRPFRWAKYAFGFWAASIAYGQVYVGVHFPFDVLAGGMVGSLIGYGAALIYGQAVAYRIDYFYENNN
jgi:membrane-associated phospholipid phosphatase